MLPSFKHLGFRGFNVKRNDDAEKSATHDRRRETKTVILMFDFWTACSLSGSRMSEGRSTPEELPVHHLALSALSYL